MSAVPTCRVHQGRFVVGLVGEAHSDESSDSSAVPFVSNALKANEWASYKKPMDRRPQSRNLEFRLIFTFHSRTIGDTASTKSEIATETVRALDMSRV